MEVTTPTGVAQSPIAPEMDDADKFQSLFDAGAFEPGGKKQEAEAPAPEAAAPEAAPEAPEAAKPEAEAKPEGEEEAPTYESLNAFLEAQKIDPESFQTLPVTVKVDGKESQVPLAEVLKGYQLSSAAYSRLAEVAQQREAFTKEQTEVRQALGTRISQAESLVNLAQQQLTSEFQAINWNALNQQDPVEYTRQMNAFQLRAVQIDQAMKQVQTAQAEQARAFEQQRAQALPAERERLFTAIPEWRDPAKMQEAQTRIIASAKKVGFTDAELNGIYDHRYLVMLDKAARYDALQAQSPAKLKQVRAAPQMAAPGARQVRDPKGSAVKNAREAWARSGFRDEDAAAAVFEHLA
ncbi:MAG: hypothetical protein KGL39_31070 [Patescibacteria group bacterium]|nr:hypothetical protein [Patescibacteria group bacterium]